VRGDFQLNKCYIGIDPGKSGGLVAIISDHTVETTPMLLAGKDIDIARTTKWIHTHSIRDSTVVCIEKVHAMPGQGVTSMFKFGFVTGVMHGIISALELPLFLVTPQTWKNKILQGTKKDKAAAVDYCRRVYPRISLLATKRSRVPHSGMADALCIARYAQLTIGKDI